MPKGNNRGTILIGSAEAEVKSSLVDFVIASFDKHVLGVTETSDLLLEAIDNEVELAIIDTNLKGLPIAKTIQILKKSKPQVPVIVISDDYYGRYREQDNGTGHFLLYVQTGGPGKFQGNYRERASQTRA